MVASPIFQPLGQAGADAFDDTRSWVSPDGYTLSDRIWRARLETRRQIDDVLRRAIVNGEDPIRVARELEQFLSPSWAPQRNERGRLVANQPKRIVTRTPRSGAGSYPARRLARTEISRAFEQAGLQASALNPFIVGRKYNLSGNHPRADECDSRAKGSSRGMDSGEYTLAEFPRLPQHPQCRCYGSPVSIRDDAALIAQLRREAGVGPPRPGEASGGGLWRRLVTLARVARAFVMGEAA